MNNKMGHVMNKKNYLHHQSNLSVSTFVCITDTDADNASCQRFKIDKTKKFFQTPPPLGKRGPCPTR